MNEFIVVWIAFQAFQHATALSKHGETRKFNYWYALIGSSVSYGLLFLGGVFTS